MGERVSALSYSRYVDEQAQVDSAELHLYDHAYQICTGVIKYILRVSGMFILWS